MPTISDYINQLNTDKATLKTNLETKGITGLSDSDTFTELVPEVLNIEAVNNQSKSVSITTNGSSSVTPDTGYTGLSEVAITTNVTPDFSKYYASLLYQGNNNSSGINYNIKELPDNYFSVYGNSCAYLFTRCNSLTKAPTLDTSSCTTFNNMFAYCSSLTEVPLYNTSGATNMTGMFTSCSVLTSIPAFNTQNVERFNDTFSNCSLLTDVPLLNTSHVTNFNNMFGGVRHLTDASLENVLAMCINATNYTGTKTLVTLGLNSAYYSAVKIQGLSNYTAFTNAGWTIGY